MNRTAIFSYYDKNGLISDYVIKYIKELRVYCDRIIFVSDCDVLNNELDKIRQYIFYSIIGRHGEYDFGSYKRGYEYMIDNNLLTDCDELIFANDSCYAPVKSFAAMFDKMEQKECDFWGVTANFNTYFAKDYHIQSYFVVLKPQVFNSDVFKTFMQSIKKEDDKHILIDKYEKGMSNILKNAGFSFDVYCELSKKHYASHILYYKKLIKKNDLPFLKRSIPLLRCEVFPVGFKRFIDRYTDYDYNLIEKDLHNKCKMNVKRFVVFIYKYVVRGIIVLGRKLTLRNING